LLSAKALDEDFASEVRIYTQPLYFPGEENQMISYSLSPQTSGIVDVLFNATNGEISLTSRKDKFGEVEFTVTANDGQTQNNTYSRKIKVTIKAVNDSPVLGPIANVQAESPLVTINLDVEDPDDNITVSMFSAFSTNNAIVKPEKIKFSTVEDGKVKMTITTEAKVGDTNIAVNIRDGNFYITQQFMFSVILITGLDDGPESDIIVFPNPVSQELQIQSGIGNGLTFILKDVHGRRLQSGTLEKPTLTIDLSAFAPGLYFLEIAGSEKIIALKKILKK
jgi:hypothetical protein